MLTSFARAACVVACNSFVRSDSVPPRPTRLHPRFCRGGGLENGMGRVGLGNASFARQMRCSIQESKCDIELGHCYQSRASPSGAPLGHPASGISARAASASALVRRISLASIACGLSGSGAASDWGEEGILSPARSPPRIAVPMFLVVSACRGSTNLYGSH